jgi:trigger factor
VDINVKELTTVDRTVTVTASREDLAEQFEAAYKLYRTRINLPGFRKGNIPVQVIRQRFGRDIELEEISKYLNRVFDKEIAPKHNPIGEAQLSNLTWEDDRLEAVFKIGVEPVFTLADLKKIKVSKLVHDVTDAEVEEEIRRALERAGTTEEVDGKITKEHIVVIDAQTLDAKKNPVEGQVDKDQRIDLSRESSEEFLKALKGHRKGDVVDMAVGGWRDKDRFRITVKEVLAKKPAAADEEFFKRQSNGEAATMDELRSHLKSRMQAYYDQTAGQILQQDIVEALIDAHPFDIPEVFVDQVVNAALAQHKEEHGKRLPKEFDDAAFKASRRDSSTREARWFFINRKLQETFTDIEITAEDIDAMISDMAAQYGIAPDQMKAYYAQQPSQLESLRTRIRDEKVFRKLETAVEVKDLDKEAFNKLKEKENKKRS